MNGGISAPSVMILVPTFVRINLALPLWRFSLEQAVHPRACSIFFTRNTSNELETLQ